RSGPASSSRDEVLGLWVVADDGVRRLLGVELEALADGDTDAVPAQQLHDLGVVGQVRAGRVTPRVTAAPVLLAEEAGEGRPVLVGEPELLAPPPVPVLGRRLGPLDAAAVPAE